MLLPLFPNTNIKEDTGKTPLDLAAYKGHHQCVQLLCVFYGACVWVQDSITRRTPVHCAAAAGHINCLELLLENAGDSNVINCCDIKQRTPLTLAVANSNPECVMLLLKYKADCNLADINKHTPLFRAVIKERDHQLVELLLAHGAQVAIQDANGKTPLHLAAACGRLVSSTSRNLSECLFSPKLNFLHRVKALASLVKANPAAATLKDDQGCTVLHWACYNGNSNCVEYLLEQNVVDSLEGRYLSVKIVKKIVYFWNLNHSVLYTGTPFSAVHCAVYQGSAHCLELLINKFGGKTVAAPRDIPGGRLPLHVAASSGSVECAKLILSSVGPELAGLETPDYSGRTPLLCAAITGQCSAIGMFYSICISV